MDFFNSAYKGIPPWDIGRPQKEIIRLAADGEISGRVLDGGCGTGENALYLAHLGFEVWGVDAAPSAIKKAKEKAKEREISVYFMCSRMMSARFLLRVYLLCSILMVCILCFVSASMSRDHTGPEE